MILIRTYQPGDGQLVCDLLTRHTSYLRDPAFWIWSNRIWPESRSIVTVAEEDGLIVGHYAILPLTLQMGERRISAGIGVHAFVAPSHRNKVPIFQISKKCYAKAKEVGIQLIWGFPNANYRLIQEKVEGWRCVELFNAWEKPVTGSAPNGMALESIDPTDPDQLLRLNDLLDATSLSGRYGVLPSLSTWLNRYQYHPQNTYQFHLASIHGETVAALVTKLYHNPESGETVGHLIDVVTTGEAEVARIVSSLENWFSTRADKLCWWPINQEFREAMEAAGFKASGFSTFFGIKLLDPELEPMLPSLLDPLNWHLAMGMSDVF